jgi:hypothetical protein
MRGKKSWPHHQKLFLTKEPMWDDAFYIIIEDNGNGNNFKNSGSSCMHRQNQWSVVKLQKACFTYL